MTVPCAASDFEGLAVGGDEDGGHEAETSRSLGLRCRIARRRRSLRKKVCQWVVRSCKRLGRSGIDYALFMAIMHAALRLDHLRNHVVDQTVLVPQALGFSNSFLVSQPRRFPGKCP